MRKFFSGSYPSHHWVQQVYSANDPRLIAIAFYKPPSSSKPSLSSDSNSNHHHQTVSEYYIYLNPTDKRGYRCIVRLVNSSDMASTFNREYTRSERVGLGILLQFMSDCYSKVMPISQISIAGNNSHQFNESLGETILGREEEPSFLHGHVYGRGNPEECYLANVKLDGPVPGVLFDMMGKSKEKGNY
ncbi:predicted protein [Naegleria gruberi]|uniref:Predicted protein n=1 Tax=Naegleria gruberi TaxID=5762 RepID=D2VV38_NAEGR|nr:uncharacterized protein NAEGRDRAFT_72880 [Naegleria gruberi]EFC39373.1 predicted protein [Naegleria gruberi]|eukprot:XP_002672117.1 predicted protein [Naegleria gruberi strain NEG-M]